MSNGARKSREVTPEDREVIRARLLPLILSNRRDLYHLERDKVVEERGLSKWQVGGVVTVLRFQDP